MIYNDFWKSQTWLTITQEGGPVIPDLFMGIRRDRDWFINYGEVVWIYVYVSNKYTVLVTTNNENLFLLLFVYHE
jgi:hypothetical protein